MAAGNSWGAPILPGNPGWRVAAWFGSESFRRLGQKDDIEAGITAFSHRRSYLIPYKKYKKTLGGVRDAHRG
jgi:hypothetical protein